MKKKEGCSINIIFKNKSESYFRLLENEITIEVLKNKKLVISLGGGAFMSKKIRSEVKKLSISFWLDVSSNILIKKIEQD